MPTRGAASAAASTGNGQFIVPFALNTGAKERRIRTCQNRTTPANPILSDGCSRRRPSKHSDGRKELNMETMDNGSNLHGDRPRDTDPVRTERNKERAKAKASRLAPIKLPIMQVVTR